MTTFLGSYERPRRQPLGETSRIGRLVRLSEDTLSAVVELGNEQFELPVSPGKYVLGANVAVLESKGKPRRVSGPAGVWPEGLDEDADTPVPVTAMVPLGPRELTAEESQAIQDTADGLGQAQADLVGVSEWAEGEFSSLGDRLVDAESSITRAEADIDALEDAQVVLADDLADATAAADMRFQDLDSMVDAHGTAISAAEGRLGTAESKIIDAEQVAAGLKSRLTSAEETLIEKADSSALAVLDSILQGPDALPSVVADKFWAGLTVTQRLEAVEGWIGGTMLEDGVVMAEVVEASEQVITDVLAANIGVFIEEVIVQGDLYAQSATFLNAALRNLSVSEKADFVTAFAQQLYADEFVARVGTVSHFTVSARNMIPGADNLTAYAGVDVPTRASLPFREFGISHTDPSVWLQGLKDARIHATIPVKKGERYRWSLDVKSSVAGTHFYMETKLPGSLTTFGGWSDLATSPNASSSSSQPFRNVAVPTANQWHTMWSEATATADGFIELFFFANHANGAPNPTGYQWWKNLRMIAMTDGTLIVPGTVEAGHVNAQSVAGALGEFIEARVENLVATAGVTTPEAVITKLWADGISALSGAFARLVVAARNLAPGMAEEAEWETHGNAVFESRSVAKDGASIRMVPTATSNAYGPVFPVTPGDSYRISATIGRHGSDRAEGGRYYLGIVGTTPDGTTAAFGPYAISGATNAAGWGTEIGGTITIPDGYTHARIRLLLEPATGTMTPYAHTTFYDVRLQPMTDGNMLVDGAVTARTLNVVPEEGTGGMELLPPGLRIIPSGGDAGTAVSLRIDEPNWFSFAKGGFNTFSVNEDGDMTGRSLDVRETLKVGGIPIETVLDDRPRGIITKTKMTQAATVGNAVARLVMATIETPSTPRAYKLTFGFHRQSASRMQITFRQSIGTTVAAGNTVQEYWYVARTADATADYVEINHLVHNSESAWGLGNTVTFGFFAEALQAGQTITFDPTHGVTMVVEDVGPAVEVIDSIPYVPSTGGGGGQGSDTGTTKKYYDNTFNPTSSRSYRGNNTAYDWNTSMLFHGYNLSTNGQLRSLAVFNRTAVNSLVSGAGTEMVSGRIRLFNAHTWANSGMTVRVGYSNHTTAPDSWDGSSGEWTWIGNYTVSRGGVLTIPLTATHLARIKSGAFNAIGLVSNSNLGAQYGYFQASKTELYVKVRK